MAASNESGHQTTNSDAANFTTLHASALAFERNCFHRAGGTCAMWSSGSSRDVKDAELDRRLEIMAEFIGRVETHADQPRELTVILRSASSGPAQALILKARDLGRTGVAAKVIVAQLDPEEDVRKLYACLSELSPRGRAHELLRWARNPRLLDAHEQVTYGTSLCWWGDSMRRDADKRNA